MIPVYIFTAIYAATLIATGTLFYQRNAARDELATRDAEAHLTELRRGVPLYETVVDDLDIHPKGYRKDKINGFTYSRRR